MQVGDCGPDQCGMRVQLAGDFKNKPKSLFFGFACLAHQTSLSECKVIALTDTICTKLWGLRFHYYSSLVKINHLFRSGTVAVGKSAKKHMDDVMMVKHISKKPGKCNTGRWGAVGEVEAHYIKVPLGTLHKNMDDAFFNDEQHNADADDDKHDASKPVDDVMLDDIKAYKQKMSKWVKASFVASKTHEFWLMMRLCHSAKQPLDHCLRVLESQPSDDDIRCGRTVLSQLVCWKGEQLFSEFADVLCDTAKWEAEAAALDAITPNMMYAALVGLVLTGACEFDIRILERLLAFPYQWLMLVHSPPHVECPLRKKCAGFLLDCKLESVDVSTAKLVVLWNGELKACKASGKLNNDIYWTLCTFRSELESTVQAVEGHIFCYNRVART